VCEAAGSAGASIWPELPQLHNGPESMGMQLKYVYGLHRTAQFNPLP
jgi:hypothetical protein